MTIGFSTDTGPLVIALIVSIEVMRLLISLFSSVYMYASINGGKIFSILIALIIMTFMTSAFLAGWLKMVKTAVENPDDEGAYLLMKEFVPGVGEFFLSSIGAVLIIFLLFGHHYLLHNYLFGDSWTNLCFESFA